MEKNRDSLGFIALEELDLQKVKNIENSNVFSFKYDKKKYFFKAIKDIEDIYNELIAEEIAKEFGISCVHYDLVSYNEQIGVISENFINDDDNYLSISQMLKKVFVGGKVEIYNNLDDIEFCIKEIYKINEIVTNLKEELINIFIYDIVIGNIDRHIDNYGIIENKYGIHFSKVYDNEKMLSYASIQYGIYSIGIERNDYYTFIEDYYEYQNFIVKFLNTNPDYKSLLEEKLKIIEDENIEKILLIVEERINAPMQKPIRDNIKNKFKINLRMIKNVLNEHKSYQKVKI